MPGCLFRTGVQEPRRRPLLRGYLSSGDFFLHSLSCSSHSGLPSCGNKKGSAARHTFNSTEEEAEVAWST